MSDSHIPVMLNEALTALSPRENGVYVDATFGAGGYARAILEAAHCALYAFDRDPRAIEAGKALARAFPGRLHLIQRPFAELEAGLGERGLGEIDGVVMDIGVSSMQLDDAARGFSFRKDGPLSMRMDGERPDARDVIARAEPGELAAIFRFYGEEKRAGAMARAIEKARASAPIETTGALAAIAEKVAGGRGGAKIHPATRIFQGLRIFVNDELGQLVDALRTAERMLRPGGRLVVVTFHSLEDRVVKRFFTHRMGQASGGSRHAPPKAAQAMSFAPVFAKALAPSEDELRINPRARSARLRAGERLSTPPVEARDEDLGLPRRPQVKFWQEGAA